tara:strand:+ start:24083 stop:24397 length:315 start_codon:yes stop_codon:yes gene_type:complete
MSNSAANTRYIYSVYQHGDIENGIEGILWSPIVGGSLELASALLAGLLEMHANGEASVGECLDEIFGAREGIDSLAWRGDEGGQSASVSTEWDEFDVTRILLPS